MKRFILICILFLSLSLLAQKKAFLKYELLKDNAPFDVRNDLLSYADSNSIITIQVKTNTTLKTPAALDINWKISKAEITSVVGKRTLTLNKVSGESFSLKMLPKIAKNCEVLSKENQTCSPRIVIEIKELVDSRDSKLKLVPASEVFTIKIQE